MPIFGRVTIKGKITSGTFRWNIRRRWFRPEALSPHSLEKRHNCKYDGQTANNTPGHGIEGFHGFFLSAHRSCGLVERRSLTLPSGVRPCGPASQAFLPGFYDRLCVVARRSFYQKRNMQKMRQPARLSIPVSSHPLTHRGPIRRSRERSRFRQAVFHSPIGQVPVPSKQVLRVLVRLHRASNPAGSQRISICRPRISMQIGERPDRLATVGLVGATSAEGLGVV